MARQKGMLNLSGNLEPLAGAPLDSRSITPTVADLYVAANWPYKYIGMKTTVTATGDTYRLVNLDVTQESSWVKEGGESGQTIQYDELPAASSTLAGKIYQYTGTTNLLYTNGYFYECVNDGGTYKWQQTNTQPGSSYNDFTGATSQAAGVHGLVPAPTTGDISKFLKGDGTWAEVPMPSFDYSNTSPEAMNFSTDEKVIGTWIDGKPLYQKTFEWTYANGSLIPNTASLVIPSTADIKCVCDGCLKYSNSSGNIGYAPIATTFPDSESIRNQWTASFSSVSVLGQSIGFNFGSGWKQNTYTNICISVTMKYTKTTDTAVASGEKIVGQWIDGKPVFEKTWSFGSKISISNANWTDTTISSSGIDRIVYACGYNLGTANDKGFYPLNAMNENANVQCLSCRDESNAPCAYITLRYTKTT